MKSLLPVLTLFAALSAGTLEIGEMESVSPSPSTLETTFSSARWLP